MTTETLRITITKPGNDRFSVTQVVALSGPLLETAGLAQAAARDALRAAEAAALTTQAERDAAIDAESLAAMAAFEDDEGDIVRLFEQSDDEFLAGVTAELAEDDDLLAELADLDNLYDFMGA